MSALPHRPARWRGTWPGLVPALLLSACALRHEPPRPPVANAAAAVWAAQRSDDAVLREALASQGVDTTVWPLRAWDADALAGLALQRHPELAVARAELRAAEAATAQAREAHSPGGEVAVEHHSEDGRSRTPWSLGVAVEALLGGGPRHAALADQADALTRAAVEQTALAVWSLHQRVHAACRTLAVAERQHAAAAALHDTRAEQLATQQARLRAGAADAREPALAREAQAQAAHAVAAAGSAARAARAQLAEAVGLPLATLDAMPLSLAATLADPPPLDDATLQRAALLNRLDLRAALARHDAAEAALRVELARQWPELSLRPGVAWDQGDRVWSLGVGLVLPPGGRNRAAIDAALAQRELQARRVEALQLEALGRLDSARAALAASEALRAGAEDAHAATERLEQRTERRLLGGDADRSERLAARAQRQLAEHRRIDALAERASAVGALENALQQPLAGARLTSRLHAAPRTAPP